MTELTLAAIQVHMAERERMDEAIDQFARQVHIARGKPDLWKEPVQIRWSTIRWVMESWELYGDHLYVTYEFPSQSPDSESVKFPAVYLEPGYDWRGHIAEELEQERLREEAKHEAKMRSLV